MKIGSQLAAAVALAIALANCHSDSTGAGGTGGRAGSAGAPATGGATGFGGASGGSVGAGGATGLGGAAGRGGSVGTGDATGSGGIGAAGGTVGSAGTTGSGGTTKATGGGSGGAGPAGGAGGSGGSNRSDAAAGGTTGLDGATATTGPCDIYQAANAPCVAAHSTVRALYGSYSGKLYQIRRASDNATQDISVLTPGGFADTSIQDSFCAKTNCVIPIIYDQSPQRNDLTVSSKAYWLPNGGIPSSATLGKTTASGHTVYGIYVSSYLDNSVPAELKNVAYRNNQTKGVATGDQAEAMYMVVDGKRFNGGSSGHCCFDYGNASTSGNDDGNGTMEAVYWGADTNWGGTGDGNGPWVAADLENGVYKGDQPRGPQAVTPSAKSIIAQFATAMLKGPSGNHFALKGGDAQSGRLTTMWDGNRPSPSSTGSYTPKSLQGAIILGTGGDGSNAGTGTFFEGAMTIGVPPDSADDAVQANIIAAGYGR
jgi:Alpha-L-arabinofuranosidase B, catalytic